MEEPKRHPFNLPKGTIRDFIALIFAMGFIAISGIFMTAGQINNTVYTNFVGMVNLVLGYYFGNRDK